MQLPVTDKFLWLLYDFYEEAGEILEPPEIFKLHSLKSAVYGDSSFWAALRRKKRRNQFAQFVYYLKSKGYIKVAELEGKKGMLLTPKGKQKVLRAKILKDDDRGLKRRKDKKWVMVLFDIPEDERRARDDFRSILYSLGFEQLQRSVWVSPYDVTRDLNAVIATYKIESYVRIFIIEEIEV